MAVGTVLSIITLVAGIATKSFEAGFSKKAADEEDELRIQQEKLEAERRDKVRAQQKRQTDIGGLERQLIKRRGAEQVARQVPGAKPVEKLAPAPPPPPPVQPTRAPMAKAPTSTDTKGISPEGVDAIGSGIELAGQIGSGIFGAASASQAAKARDEEAARIAKLEEEEFQKNLAAKKRDVNLSGLDFQSKAAAGPSRTSRQNTFASDFMNVLRSVKNQNRRAA